MQHTIPTKLTEQFQNHSGLIIAFSGGVDSTVLACSARRILGKENVLAVTITSEFVSKFELTQAIIIAKTLDITHSILSTTILDNPKICANIEDRCYHCKFFIYSQIKNLFQIKIAQNWDIVDGTNFSDDKNRPGRLAMKELNIISPLELAKITKSEIRLLAKNWNLPNYNKPSNSCLATRIEKNNFITQKELLLVERMEDAARTFGAKNIRAHILNNFVYLSVEKSILPEITNHFSFLLQLARDLGAEQLYLTERP